MPFKFLGRKAKTGCRRAYDHKKDANLLEVIQARLEALGELDESTKTPSLLVELSTGPGRGQIEICGKDEYGAYDQLTEWLTAHWGCVQVVRDVDEVPFCGREFSWSGFQTTEGSDVDNMLGCMMELVNFMCGKLTWTLEHLGGGPAGKDSTVNEYYLMFTTPHPMNLVTPHLMIEMRSRGLIEVGS